jgi:glycosyltransferase involved in cell wall biosynthesis
MPLLTAILHTLNDAPRLGRALESLRPCDEILVVDHGSTDATLRVAREYGATIRSALPDLSPAHHLRSARYPWAFCVLPSEALTEDLEASLFEWKLCDPAKIASIAAGSALIREETLDGWKAARPSTRLIPKTWNTWEGMLPRDTSNALILQGDLLRFRSP